jgi:hypothetical protein
MFCTKCQQFWNEAIARANKLDQVATCQDVKWLHHEVILHNNLRELDTASDSNCAICRIIWHVSTEKETYLPFRRSVEPIHVTIDIDPTRGPHPVLSVTIHVPSRNLTIVPKRTIAICGGLLNDGMCSIRQYVVI